MTAALQLIDSHTHLDSKDFLEDRAAVISRAQQAGVVRLVTIGAGGGDGFGSAKRAIAIAEEFPNVWASAGIHPHDAATPLDRGALKELLLHPRVVAVGETGLDFFRDWSPRDAQEIWFETQIELALEVKKPLIIHSREAGNECLETLQRKDAKEIGGVFHCYAENAEFAAKLRELNFLVSFPGSVTFKNAEALRETVRNIPLTQIMVETDAPYMAPVPYRGKRCESAFMVETAKMIAQLHNLSLEECAAILTANTIRFYKLPAIN
jgi:TatD DNase family protein